MKQKLHSYLHTSLNRAWDSTNALIMGLKGASVDDGRSVLGFLTGNQKASVLSLLFMLLMSVGSFAQTLPTDDFDGDGIINSLDIDDDNDGVPDYLEQNCPAIGTFTNWTSIVANNAATGTLALTSGNVGVTYTSSTVASIQNISWYDRGDGYKAVIPASGANGLQSINGVNKTHTYTFSQPLVNPILIFWSNNGNTYTFDKPFRIFGTPTASNTIISSTAFSANAEGSIAVQFMGTISSVSYTSSIAENWTGVTVGVQQCTDIDTDGDTVMNRFDLDSDGDTCSDAFESGATTTKTANYAFSSAVSANGLANSLETAPENGSLSYPLTYNYAIAATQNMCIDSDNDGVADVVDVDDDNDGILDAVENQCPTFAKWTDWTAVTANASATGTLPLSTGNVTVTYASPQVYSVQQPGYFNIGDVYTGTMPASGTEGLQALHGAGTTHTYTFSQPVTNPILVFWSMNGNTFTFTKPFNILGQTAGITSSTTMLSGSSAVECNASIQLIGTYTSITYTSSLLENWTGVTVGTNYCPDINTDGGAVVNRLQLDSDGDGCSDAYEGGATTDKTANYAFAGAVGTNGLDNSLETVADNGTVNYRNSYSSFATDNAKVKCTLQSPGGVITGLGWWYEGDAGVTTSGTAVTKWNDQSPSALDVTQVTASRQPKNTKYQNFNKVMTFDGGDALNNATGFWQTSTNNTAYNVFAVTNHVSGTGSVNALFSENTNLGQHTLFNDYGGNAYNGIWASNYAYTPYAAFSAVPQLLTSRYNNVGTVKQLSFNAKTSTMTSGGAAAAFNGNGSNLVIGNYLDQGSWPLNGDIAEIAMYASDLSATQRQQVESYLAIKWGVSLDQTTAYNYLNSSGVTIWNATANSGYKNNIIGIGRDDAAGLNQKQSQSGKTGFQPIIGNGTGIAATNAANANTFSADKSFDLIGDNGLASTFGVLYLPSSFTPVSPFYAMNRIWKVQETGTVGTVTISIPLSIGAERLLVSGTSGFVPASTQEIPLVSDGNGNMTASVDLTDGQFFTFGRTAVAPGCVAANLKLWIKADGGTVPSTLGSNLTDWADQSTSNQKWLFVGSDPQLVGNAVNFNPTVNFDGNDFFRTDVASGTANFTSAFTSGEVFSVAKAQATNLNSGNPWDFGGYWESWYPYSNGYMYQEFGSNLRKAWHPVTKTVIEGGGTTSGPAVAVTDFNLYNVYSATNDWQAAFNGTTAYTSTSNVVNFAAAAGGNHIGAISGAPFYGDISEVALYDRKLTTPERQRVNSYMGIKYGLTLGHNYLSGAGTTIYDISTYGNNVFGIGRDDCQGLLQKQSKSINTTGFVTISNGTSVAATNAANTSTLTDVSFEVIGDNNLAADYTTAYTPSFPTNGLFFYSMARIWKVQETGTVGQVTIRITGTAQNTYLLVKNAATFTSGATEYPMTKDGKGNLVATIDLATGDYFTFATPRVAPGAVTMALSRWYKADYNASSTAWNDASPNLKNTTTATGSITFNNTGANFNPYVNFNSGYFQAPAAYQGINTDNTKVFTVNIPKSASNNTSWGQQSTSGNNIAAYNPNADGQIYFDAPWAYRTNTNFVTAGGVLGVPTLVRDSKFGGSNYIHLAGKQISTAGTGTFTGNFPGSAQLFHIGAQNGATSNNDLAELVIYENASAMTAAQVKQIESYLAIKYGITLDQTTATNYVNSANAIIWNATTNSGYKKDITVIGRDDASGLDQAQSMSVNASALVTIGLGTIAETNIANTNNFTADKSFDIIGDNGLAAMMGTAITGPSGVSVNNRYTRIWKVQESGTVGTVKVGFPEGLGNGLQVYLVRSTDATFDGTDEFIPLSNLAVGSTNYLAASIDFNNGDYFTVATYLTAPGCVAANLSLWLKADNTVGIVGSNVANWKDNSTTGNDVEVAGTMTLQAGDVDHNFQPYFGNFSSTNFFKDYNSSLSPANVFTASEVTMIAAVRPNSAGTGRIMGIDNDDNFAGEPALSLFGGKPNYYRYWNTTKDFVTSAALAITPNQSTVISARTNGTEIKVGNGGAFETSTVVAGSGMWGDIMTVGYGTWSAAGAFPGEIQEVIWYKSNLSDVEVQKINSYLGVKYGTTLQQNYLSGSGSTIYDVTTGYGQNVGGIGRELCQGLNQKQSRSQNLTTQPIIGLTDIAATNAANTAVLTEGSYMMWGSDAGAASFGTPIASPSGITINNRFTRIWKVQETGTVGTVQVALPSGLNRGLQVYLVRSTNATFDATDEFIPLSNLTVGATEYAAADIDFATGDYFTFATYVTSPGCLPTAMWLKADGGVYTDNGVSNATDGQTVQQWNDAASNFDVAQPTAASKPLFKQTTGINFNPSVSFDGSNDFLKYTYATTNQQIINRTDGAMYVISRSNTLTNANLVGFNDNANHPSIATQGSNSKPFYYSGQFSYASGTVTPNVPYLFGSQWRNNGSPNGTTLKATTFLNGNLDYFTGLSNVDATTLLNHDLRVGNDTDWGTLNGDISEVVIFEDTLTTPQRARVESYLSLKYGITLPYDYVDGSGTTIYARGAYVSNIFGIGREDCQSLNQKQSKSVNAGIQPVLATSGFAANNAANTTGFSADNSFEMIGSDAGATTFGTAIAAPLSATANNRMTRIWKVQETGTVGAVKVAFPTGLGNGGTLYLVRSTDATFNASDEFIPLSNLTVGSTNYMAADIDFANGDYFTIATYLVAPGGVTSNLNMWLKADALTGADGSKVTSWSDAYLSNYTVDQTTVAQQPTLYTNTAANLVNFNPSVKFNNAASQLLRNNTASPLTSTGISFHFIAVAKDQEAQNAVTPNYGSNRIRGIMGNGLSGDNPAMDFQKDGASFNGFNPYSSLVGEYNGGKSTMYNGGGVGTTSGTGTLVLPSANVTRLINQQPQIVGLGYTAGTTTKINGSIDGFTEATNLTDNNAAYTGAAYYGLGHSGGGEYWNGTINEMLAYDRELTTLEAQKVNTYLAIKYGVTLGQGNGNVGLNTGYNYLATDGTTALWNTTTNAGYNYDIAVIGKDVAEGLNQKQSKSVNAGVQPTIALSSIATSNQSNSGTFNADMTFEAWGSNGLGAGYNTNYTPTSYTPTDVFKRMDRKWKVQETGTVGTVAVQINSNADYMLVDTDGDGNFATGTITEVLLTNKQGFYNFNNGDVFTFGRKVTIQACDNGLAFIHGDDAANSSNSSTIGLSAWKSNGNGTFSTVKVAQTGFLTTGTGTFGNDGTSSTFNADVNNDGLKDIIHATESNSNSIYVYLNNGDGTFSTTPVVTTNMQANTDVTVFAGESGAEQAWMGDADGDGYVDYIQSGTDKNIHVYLGLGDGKFATTRITSALTASGYLTSGISGAEVFFVGDVNNDGSVDLIGTYDPGHMVVWLGNGDGTFQANPYFDADIQDSGSSNSSGNTTSEYSQFADVDGDGDIDYVHAEGLDGTPQIWAYLNAGDGTFATTAVLSQATSYPKNTVGEFGNYTAAATSTFNDVNNDGKADYVITVDNGTAAQNGIYVYLATSGGTFTPTPVFTNIATGFATGINGTESSFIACGFIICNAGVQVPKLSAITKTNTCPATKVDLSTITATNKPNGTVLTWHTATLATYANRVADSTMIVTAGTYYASFFDGVNGCFSGNGDSTKAVTVTITSPCPATFTFNCATASSTGTFTANGTGGQAGTLVIPLTSATAGTATFNVAGTGFTGTLSTTLTAAQASVSIPITYDGTGAARSQALTVTSTGGTGTCTPSVTIGGAVATYTFDCAGATATGTFIANATAGQTGTLTIGLTGTTAGSVTYTVTGAGFTGSFVGTLTAGQTSVIIPITYDGTGTARTQTLTVTGTGSTGSCTPSVSVICGAGADAPNLATNAITNACPQTTANLSKIAVGNKPVGSVLTWHNASTAGVGTKVADSTAVPAGTYYAIFYNVAQDCYGGATAGTASTSVVVTAEVCPADIVVTNTCPSNTVDLTTRINGTIPSGKVVTWHTGLPATDLNKVATPSAITASGTYYAAYYETANTCYSPASTNGIAVTITLCPSSNAGTNAPNVTATLENVCPATSANLSTITASNQPLGTTLSWHTGGTASSTNVLTGISAVPAGTYYVAFYDANANDYSPTAAVVVTITTCAMPCNATATGAPILSATAAVNACPIATANLSTITASNLPFGTVMMWHTSATPTYPNRVTDSSVIASTATYYAAFYDIAANCFSTSTSSVAVTITPCVGAFTFNCGTASVSGTFAANAVTGQTGSVTLPISGVTAGTATFTVTGTGFTGTLSTTLAANATSVTVPITFDGSGVAGTRPLSITSSEGTGSCAVNATVSALIATFTFDCATAPAVTGTFVANATAGQTGSITVQMTGATAGDATFTITGAGFTGTLTTTLTANQASVSVPITYDGTGAARTQALTITSSQGTGTCSTNATITAQVATFAFNCGAASTTGTFVANGTGGQTGSVTIPMTGATAGTATFTVTGTGFTGTLTTTLTANQASVSVPITYDGTGAARTQALTITSSQGTGTCSTNATITAQVATFAFNCGAASATGTFVANGTAGQTGSVTIPMTGATAGTATFTVTGAGFTGTLNTTLTANQASVSVPITYNGGGIARTQALTIASTEGSGTCSANATVTAQIATFAFDCSGGILTVGSFVANGTAGQNGSLTIPITGATAGTATFTVTGAGFTGTLTTTLTPNQATVSVPITYDGTGAARSQALTITSSQGSGTCSTTATVSAQVATFTFNCGSATASGTFTANSVTGQTGSVTISLTNATAGSATFTVTGTGFTGTLSTTLTANQASVVIPITYDGTGSPRTEALTIASPQGTGACAVNATVIGVPDLTTTIGQPLTPLTVGQSSDLPITVANIGNGAAPGIITTTITLPAGVTAPPTFMSNGWTCNTSAPSVVCTNAGPIAAGGSSTFNVPVTPGITTVGTKPTFTATTNPVTGETNTGNNPATPLVPTVNVLPANCDWTPGTIGK